MKEKKVEERAAAPSGEKSDPAKEEKPEKPVSYTHLDVYKRQTLYIGTIGSSLYPNGDEIS